MGFDFQHGFVVIDFLAAIWTFIEFHHRDGVGLSLVAAGDVTGHALDFVTAAGGTGFDLEFVVHGLSIALFDSLAGEWKLVGEIGG